MKSADCLPQCFDGSEAAIHALSPGPRRMLRYSDVAPLKVDSDVARRNVFFASLQSEPDCRTWDSAAARGDYPKIAQLKAAFEAARPYFRARRMARAIVLGVRVNGGDWRRAWMKPTPTPMRQERTRAPIPGPSGGVLVMDSQGHLCREAQEGQK